MTDDDASCAPLELLVLGGTSWLGGAVAGIARTRGHRVTCLARGVSGEAPDGVELVRADRDDPVTAYRAVTGRPWDAVLDLARQPLHVRGALDALAGAARHWVFVSTCSVYADDSRPGADESAALHAPWHGEGLAPDDEYGPAKVACERAVLDAVPDALVARAGLIVGYGDRSDRFGYWPARFARAAIGERVLVPPADQSLQVVDVEDLAAWLVRCAEGRTGGVLNAIGMEQKLGALIDLCLLAAAHPVDVVCADDAWLQEQEVLPWMGPDSLPLWLPRPTYAGFMSRANDAARSAGLRFRPLAESVQAALRWERERGVGRDRRAGLSPGRERELLARLSG
jgi:nucleoside-diphosphate-sugar epimerase